MALFVLGAGATRGCSFVDPTKNPCLPPLDSDFFTQLQRIPSPEHKQLIDDVLQEVTTIFGVNFSVTMETVFTTLEHTVKLIQTTEKRSTTFSRKQEQYAKTRDNLIKAIAAMFESSLLNANNRHRQCRYHQKLVKNILKAKDTIVSFNYDCVIDHGLKRWGDNKWDAKYGYGIDTKGNVGVWQAKQPSHKNDSIKLYKLHGSLHFNISQENQEVISLKENPYTDVAMGSEMSIIPPEWHKKYDGGIFPTLWRQAADAINQAEHIVIIGYSLPLTDMHSTALFRTSIGDRLKTLIVVNPDKEARNRIRSILQKGINPNTRVLSVDKLSEFVAIKRDLWDSDVKN